MENLSDKKIIVVVGPTAVGKTTYSIELAKELNGEIINGDSVQVYKGLDIGSAKVTCEEMQGVKHHLLDIREPNEEYTVKDFQSDCRKKIKEINDRGNVAIIVGGSGLYVSSVLYDYEFEEYTEDSKGILEMNEDEIIAIFKEKYEHLDEVDSKNIVRLKNYVYKKEYGIELKKNREVPYYDEKDFIIVGLTMPRDKLYDRINMRVDRLIEQGLIDEVKQFNQEMPSQTAIGYKEVHMFIAGKCSKEEMIELIKRNSRRFAKRQMTWFRNKMKVNWIEVYDGKIS